MTAEPSAQDLSDAARTDSGPPRVGVRMRFPRGLGDLIAVALAFLPIYALTSQAMASVKYGVDIPYWDDWVQYLDGKFGSLDLAYLFEPRSGTVYAVGKALDSLEQLFLGGNTVVYQVLSMLVLLGLLLFFQFRLLRQALGGLLVTCAAFVLTMPMLRPDTYWGLITLAYHQGIPTVVLLGSLWLILRSSRISRGRGAVVLTLGVIAGLSYISGAFAITAFGISLVVLSWFTHSRLRSNLVRGGMLLTIGGLTTLAIQLVDIFGGSGGPSGLAWPWDPRFWAYYLGEIGGSLALPPQQPNADALRTLALLAVIATAALLLMVVRSLRWLARHRTSSVHRVTAPLTLITLTAAIAVYLALVAAARARVDVAPDAPLAQVFAVGLAKEHPFWVTLLWPWVGASFIQVFRNRGALFRRWPFTRRSVPYAAAVVALALVGASASKGSYDYQSWYSAVLPLKTDLVTCIDTGINAGVPLYCQPGEPSLDLTNAVLSAMDHDASFTRYVQFSPTPDSDPALFSLASTDPSAIQISAGSTISQTSGGWTISAQNNAVATIATGDSQALAACRALEITAIVRAEQQVVVQVFWSPADRPESTMVSMWNVGGGGISMSMHFFLISPSGFADSLRLHFIQDPQDVDLKDVQVRCRVGA